MVLMKFVNMCLGARSVHACPINEPQHGFLGWVEDEETSQSSFQTSQIKQQEIELRILKIFLICSWVLFLSILVISSSMECARGVFEAFYQTPTMHHLEFVLCSKFKPAMHHQEFNSAKQIQPICNSDVFGKKTKRY
ncbi:hypothetical protein LXL04_013208 [Taraxacum kok-saghyz]